MVASPAAGGCALGADNRFGPQIDISCRVFDFTLLLEDTILVALPAAVFLLLLPARLRTLRKEPVKLQSYKLLTWKLVDDCPVPMSKRGGAN